MTEENTGVETDVKDTAGSETEETKPETTAKYTDEDVNRMINEKYAKWNKSKEEELAKKQAEAEESKKLKKMNDDQKTQYQIEKLTKQLEEAKSTNAKFAMTKQAQTMFEDVKIPVTSDDLDHVVTADAESTKANVQWLINHDAAVRERTRQEFLTGETPRDTAKSITAVSQKDFDLMDFSDRAKLAKEDPDQFKKLTGGL